MKFIKPKRQVKRVFIHCSASDNPKHDNLATMRKWHTSPDPNDPSKPWSDVGYHYYIRKDGTIEQGRSLERTPAAQGKRHNSSTIAICVGGLSKEKFTEAQFMSLKELCRQIHEVLPSVTFHGHQEVNKYKTCPVFDYKKVLGLDPRGQLLTN